LAEENKTGKRSTKHVWNNCVGFQLWCLLEML